LGLSKFAYGVGVGSGVGVKLAPGAALDAATTPDAAGETAALDAVADSLAVGEGDSLVAVAGLSVAATVAGAGDADSLVWEPVHAGNGSVSASKTGKGHVMRIAQG
jgi:hypothetical protein